MADEPLKPNGEDMRSLRSWTVIVSRSIVAGLGAKSMRRGIRTLVLATGLAASAAIAEESTIDLGKVLGEAKGIWSLNEAGCRLVKTGEFDRLSRAEASKFGVLRIGARSLEWMSSAASCSYAGYEFYPKPGILIYGLCEFRGSETRDLIELEPKRDGPITLRFRNGFWNQGKPAKYVRCSDRCASMICNTEPASAPEIVPPNNARADLLNTDCGQEEICWHSDKSNSPSRVAYGTPETGAQPLSLECEGNRKIIMRAYLPTSNSEHLRDGQEIRVKYDDGVQIGMLSGTVNCGDGCGAFSAHLPIEHTLLSSLALNRSLRFVRGSNSEVVNGDGAGKHVKSLLSSCRQ